MLGERVPESSSFPKSASVQEICRKSSSRESSRTSEALHPEVAWSLLPLKKHEIEIKIGMSSPGKKGILLATKSWSLETKGDLTSNFRWSGEDNFGRRYFCDMHLQQVVWDYKIRTTRHGAFFRFRSSAKSPPWTHPLASPFLSPKELSRKNESETLLSEEQTCDDEKLKWGTYLRND